MKEILKNLMVNIKKIYHEPSNHNFSIELKKYTKVRKKLLLLVHGVMKI